MTDKPGRVFRLRNVWKYKGIYRLNDQQVGQRSDVATIGVMG